MPAKYKTRYASSPHAGDIDAWFQDAVAEIKAAVEVECNLDPRKPMLHGDLVALVKGLHLTYQHRSSLHGQHLWAVYGRPVKDAAATPIYLGNEVRADDGRVIGQRWRSPEASQAFRAASSKEDRYGKMSNLFLTNWVTDEVDPREARSVFIVGWLPSDQTAGVANRLAAYCDKHTAEGRVDLRAALPGLCKALDDADAEAKAKAEAEAKAAADAAEALKATAKGLLHRRGNRAHPEHFRTVALWRAACREAAIPGVGPKATDGQITEALNIAAGYFVPEPEPEITRAVVTAEEKMAITIAANLIDAEDGVSRLWRALKAAGVAFKVPETKEATKAVLLEIARNCEVAKTAQELDAVVEAPVEA